MIRIGITTSYHPGENEQRLHLPYVEAVEQAGGLPLLVPMLERDDTAAAFAELLDGLVLVGGPAIAEGLVGELPDDIDEVHPRRLASDRRILHAFLSTRRPVLGICYGMQLLNAEAGGTIYADIEAQRAGSLRHSATRGATEHPMLVQPGTHLHRILGRDEMTINTRHIQAVEQVGAPYRVAATAPDGTIEAIENEDGTILGMQFHPERMGTAMQPLFAHLIERARAARAVGIGHG